MQSFADSVFSGQRAALDNQGLRRNNALADLQLQRAQKLNSLAADPAATPEQYVRAGDPQTGSALLGVQDKTQADKQAAIQKVGSIAQRALSLDPTQRRAYIHQAVSMDHESFRALGADPERGLAELEQLPDDQLEQRLSQIAMSGPAQQQTIGDVNNPGASGVLQRDPTTGALKQIVAPQKPPDVQHTQNGLIFDPSKGVYLDPNGRPMNANQVRDWNISLSGDKASATANARNNAQASAISEGDMSTAVSAFRQGIGNPPSMTRNPTAYAAFWNEYKAQAKNEGNTVQQQLADQRISQSLKPAMEQTSKQIAANEGFLATLEKNIASADELQKRVAGNDPQYMNRVFNAWKRGVSTDPKMAGDIAALDRWNNAIQGEAAKIASGGVGSVSASSDGQIQEQMKLMNSAQTYSAWRSSANAAIEEGKNRMDSLYSSRDSLMHQSAGKSGNATPPAASPQSQPKSPAITATGPNGQRIQLVNGQWVPLAK